MAATLLTLGVAVLNDHDDYVKGVDQPERLRPGHPLTLGIGLRTLRFVGLSSTLLGASLSASVVADARLPIVFYVFPVLFVLFTLTYASGPKPYSHMGLGEIMIFLNFGVFAALGSFYIQNQNPDRLILLAIVAVGSMAAAAMSIQNERDRDTDSAAGKITLAVRLGPKANRSLYSALLAIPYIVAVVAAATEQEPLILYSLISLPVAIWYAAALQTAKDRAQLTLLAKRTFYLTGIYSTMLAASLIPALHGE